MPSRLRPSRLNGVACESGPGHGSPAVARGDMPPPSLANGHVGSPNVSSSMLRPSSLIRNVSANQGPWLTPCLDTIPLPAGLGATAHAGGGCEVAKRIYGARCVTVV